MMERELTFFDGEDIGMVVGFHPNGSATVVVPDGRIILNPEQLAMLERQLGEHLDRVGGL